MLTTVVRNLLLNAVKFTPVCGMVTLSLIPNPYPKERGENNPAPSSGGVQGVEVSVTDTGIGMTDDQINNMFCLNSSHLRLGTAGEQGSGLGLIVCRELLEKHGSKLHVESEEGKGSKFWFTV